MTDRERWIVYPLLFLALGLALKPKMTQHFDVHDLESRVAEIGHVRCQSLTCGDPESDNYLMLTSDRRGPQINLIYNKGLRDEEVPIFASDLSRQQIQIGYVVVHSEKPPAGKPAPEATKIQSKPRAKSDAKESSAKPEAKKEEPPETKSKP